MRALAEFEGYLDDFRVDENNLIARAFGPIPQCQVFVAPSSGHVTGYAVVLEIPFTYDLRPTVVLKELYIAEDSRGKGLGKSLMHAVAEWACMRGAGRLKWDVLVGNQLATRFYEQLGASRDEKWLAYQMDCHCLERLAKAYERVGR